MYCTITEQDEEYIVLTEFQLNLVLRNAVKFVDEINFGPYWSSIGAGIA